MSLWFASSIIYFVTLIFFYVYPDSTLSPAVSSDVDEGRALMAVMGYLPMLLFLEAIIFFLFIGLSMQLSWMLGARVGGIGFKNGLKRRARVFGRRAFVFMLTFPIFALGVTGISVAAEMGGRRFVVTLLVLFIIVTFMTAKNFFIGIVFGPTYLLITPWFLWFFQYPLFNGEIDLSLPTQIGLFLAQLAAVIAFVSSLSTKSRTSLVSKFFRGLPLSSVDSRLLVLAAVRARKRT